MRLKISDKLGIKERLLSHKMITPNTTNCWRYLGKCNFKGYGVMEVENVGYVVSRLSLYVYTDDFDIKNKNILALHKNFICNYKDCFNPNHLYKGSQKDNMKDCVELGTHLESSRTHCNRGHEFNESNTVINSKGYRECKICRVIKNYNTRYGTNLNEIPTCQNPG